MQGAKFAEVGKMTDIFEGSIIRAMRRLEELLRQLGSAAKSIGNVRPLPPAPCVHATGH